MQAPTKAEILRIVPESSTAPIPRRDLGLTPMEVLSSAPFLLVHIAALSVFFVPFHWSLVALCMGSFFLRMFGITGAYHRYFSHRSYKANRVMQFLLGLLGTTAVQKGPLWWAANHRLHHRHSDQPQDIHSPIQRGFFWSHVGWIMSSVHDETRWDQIQDLAKFPELRWLNKYYLIPGIAYGTAFFLLGGWGALAWGFLLSTVLLWHFTFFINSMAHVVGSRRYETTDTSRNNFWLALLTMGEGWHNNHHCYMSSTRQGFYWWEIDMTYYILRTFSALRLVRDLREPPLLLLEGKRIRKDDQAPGLNRMPAILD